MKKRQSIPESFHFAYEDTVADSLLVALEKQTGGLYENGVFRLPTAVGDGTVHLYSLEEGLFLRYFNFTPAIDFNFHTKSSVDDERFYHLYFILDKGFQNMQDGKTRTGFKIASNSIFMPNTHEVTGCFKAGNAIKAIALLFTPAWAERNKLITNGTVSSVFNTIGREENATLLLNNIEFFDYNAASSIHRFIAAGEEISLKIRINCLLLVNRFFAQLSLRKTLKPHNKSGSVHFSEIVELEARVCEHLDTGLPHLKNLAIQFHMSASTLKRHFKAVYGKNIYAYYLEKKMDLAKKLLLKDGLSISEVAYSLGYEKAGSLTSAFKKVYGFLPREMKNCG